MVQIHNIIKSRFKIMFNTDKLSNKIIHINHRIKKCVGDENSCKFLNGLKKPNFE